MTTNIQIEGLKIMSNYLIQRITKNNVIGDDDGIDRIIQFDYMGSFEFENGSLPKTIAKIAIEQNNYKKITFTIDGKQYFSYIPSHVDDFQEQIVSLINGETQTKEPTGMKAGSAFPKETITWLNIDKITPWFMTLEQDVAEYFMIHIQNKARALQENHKYSDFCQSQFEKIGMGDTVLIPASVFNKNEYGLVECKVAGKSDRHLTFKQHNKKVKIHYSLVGYL